MFLADLMPHQAAAVQWLHARPNAMLAWEMGVGKTAPLLRAWETTRERGPALVLCLASARENWKREAIKFALDPDWPPNVQILKRQEDPIDLTADAVIINFDKLLIPMFMKRLRAAKRWGALIIDEAHALKSGGAKRTQLVYGGLKGNGAAKQTPLIENAERVWLATGTPMPNHPAELYAHARALWPDTLQYQGHTMELWEFEAAFCHIRQNKYGMAVVGGRNLPELKARMAPVLHRLRRKDVLNLPPLTIDTWPLDTETVGSRQGIPDLPDLLATLAVRYGNPNKIDSFDSATLDAYLACIGTEFEALAIVRRETATLKAVAAGLTLKEEFEHGAPKTIVFAYHREAIDTLAKILAKFNPAVIHGGVPLGKRQDEIDRFQDDPACHVFIGQHSAAGASINLQAGKNILFVEAAWSPGINDQCIGRAYRNGQTEPVSVRFAYLPNSIDEAVNRALARKAAMIAQVID